MTCQRSQIVCLGTIASEASRVHETHVARGRIHINLDWARLANMLIKEDEKRNINFMPCCPISVTSTTDRYLLMISLDVGYLFHHTS
jgi:hypothetical protein